MKTWKDNRGRSWEIDITWGVLRRIPGHIGTSLTEIITRLTDAPSLEDLADFSGVLLFVLQQSEPALTDEEFTKLTEGGFVELAQVVAEEITDFFQRQGLEMQETPNSE